MKRVKKTYMYVSLIMILLMITGCENDTNKKANDGMVESNTKVYSSESMVVNEDNEEYLGEKNYYILKNVIKNDNVDVEYPAIEGLNNSEQGIWNKLMYDKVNEYICNVGEDEGLTLTYEIMTENSQLLSIVFYGTSYVRGTDNQYRFVYSYNIDINTGKNIRLEESRDIDKLAYSIFNGLDYTIVEDTIEEDVFKSYIESFFESSTELSELLSEFDYEDMDSYPSGYSYYKDDKLYMCFEVNHSMRDYVVISVTQ